MNLTLDSFEFGVHTQIYFGVGALHTLPEIARRYGYRKLLVCTDPGIAKSGALAELERLLQDNSIEYVVFSDVEPDPSLEVVYQVRDIYVRSSCNAFVAMGGGSSIDTAKGASVAVSNEGELGNFEGNNKIPNRGPDVIAVPTTAGTGSEVTHAAVLRDTKRQYKMGIRSEHLYPKAAILDPKLLTTLPPRVAAITGIDALSHGIESYTSNQAQPITDALGLHAIRLIGQNLRPFVARRGDLDAASHMMLASTIAGAAFIWGRVAAVHALSHPLGGRYGIAHGLANSILLPVVMEYNLGSNLAKFRDIAVALGENVQGLSIREAAERSVVAVKRLIADLDIPTRLTQLNVELTDTEVEVVAQEALESGIASANPRDVSLQDLKNILIKVL